MWGYVCAGGRVGWWVVASASEPHTMFAVVSLGVFTLGDARSFSGLMSKIPPLGSMLNFDTDVKNDRASPM